MTDDLRSLYQEIIVDHNRRPRNFREIPDADRTANGDNPLCGDRLTVYLNVREGVIRDIGFVENGCAISCSEVDNHTAVAADQLCDLADVYLRQLATHDPAHHGKRS